MKILVPFTERRRWPPVEVGVTDDTIPLTRTRSPSRELSLYGAAKGAFPRTVRMVWPARRMARTARRRMRAVRS